MSGSITPAPIGLRDVLAGAPDVVFCCDQDGRWVWISPSIESLVGYRPADLIGHDAFALIADVERRAAARHLLRLRHGRRPAEGQEFECSAMSLSGHVVRVAFKLNRIVRPDGDLAYVGIARRGAPHRTGFRSLRDEETAALTGQSAKPYAAPAHRNDPARTEAPRPEPFAGWSAAGLNDLDSRLSGGADSAGAPASEDVGALRGALEEAEQSARTAAAERERLQQALADLESERARLEHERGQADALAKLAETLAAEAQASSRSAADELAQAHAEIARLRETGNGEPMYSGGPGADARVADLERACQSLRADCEALHAERDHLAEDLEEARRSLRDRSDHFASVSHEIRTPMNGVIGMAQLLLETSLDGEQREMVEVIRQSSHSLLAIINDALEFSRIDAGKIEIESMDFDLRVTVEQIAALLGPMATQKGVEVELKLHHDVPSKLQGDPGRLRQVLLNLASNAIKLAGHGTIQVRVERVDEHEDEVELRFVVEDPQHGIASEQVRGVLQSFAQDDPVVARRYGGTGLGLFVSRRLVTIMHGQAGVDGVEGGGCRLWFQLSLKKQAHAPDSAEPTLVELNGIRVLVVDPASTVRQSMAEILTAWGGRVDQASNHDEAMARLEEAANTGDPVRVALIDIQLPGVSGDQLGERIRRHPTLADTRTMLLTSVGRKGDAGIATRAGFSAYLIKPVPWSELYDALIEVLRHPATPIDEPAAGLVTRHSLAEARRGRLKVLLVEDDPVNRLVTEWALRRHGYAYESVERAGEALEVCARSRFDLILMDLHMPDMDGYKTASALRARERGGVRTPIVAMTGNALPGERERCLAAGMDDYLTKPIDLGLLCDTVERWTQGLHPESAGLRAATAGLSDAADLSRTPIAGEPRLTESVRVPGGHKAAPRISIVGRAEYERIRTTEEPEATPEAAAPAPTPAWADPAPEPPIDDDRLNDTSMGIPALRDALLNTFLGDVDERVDRLQQSIEAKDARRVEFEAHGLKGMSATVGARHCVGVFAELERCGRENDLSFARAPLDRARFEVSRVRAHLEAQRGGTEDQAA